ncbi:hypothetical protein P4O66_006660, partial [Electrophorus voltai]
MEVKKGCKYFGTSKSAVSNIFNISQSTSTLPVCFKIATIVPLQMEMPVSGLRVHQPTVQCVCGDEVPGK